MAAVDPVGSGARGDEGALAAVLPVTVRSVVTDDPSFGRALRHEAAGADQPDAAVMTDPRIDSVTDAPVVVAMVDEKRLRDGGSRPADAGLRVIAHLVVRRRATTAARRLRSAGLDAQVLFWDHRQAFPLPARRAPAPAPWTPTSYPRHALVVACRDGTAQTVADAALVAAGRLVPELALATEGGSLVVVTADEVVRVALGAGRSEVLGSVKASQVLRAAEPDPVVADRVPWMRDHGTAGLGVWSVERRLRGARATLPLSRDLSEQCRAMLVALFGLGPAPGRLCAEDAWRVSSSAPRHVAGALARLAEAADRVLSDVPRGFGHGDFWYENLLVDGGNLAGVLDWDSAGPGRRPLLDLLHLMLTARRRVPGYRWGDALVAELMPWADVGGDELAQRYCRDLGVDASPAVLRALVVAYWLDRLRYQLDRYADRAVRPAWVANNIVRVARSLAEAGWARGHR